MSETQFRPDSNPSQPPAAPIPEQRPHSPAAVQKPRNPLIDNKAIQYEPGSSNTSTGYEVKKGNYRGNAVIVKSLTGIHDQWDKLSLAEALVGEAKILSSLEHPRLVPFLGIIVDAMSIVFENSAQSISLDDYLSQGLPLNWSQKYTIATDVAIGMAYLHSEITLKGKGKKKEMVHQDLKGANVIICRELNETRAKVADYGLSDVRKRLKTLSQARQASVLVSNSEKEAYLHIAPESFQTQRYTTLSDSYSYGTILVQLVTMKLLRQMGSFASEMALVTQSQVIPDLFLSLIRSCLNLETLCRPSFNSIVFFLLKEEPIIVNHDIPRDASILSARMQVPKHDEQPVWLVRLDESNIKDLDQTRLQGTVVYKKALVEGKLRLCHFLQPPFTLASDQLETALMELAQIVHQQQHDRLLEFIGIQLVQPCLITEYCFNETLSLYLKSHDMTWQERFTVSFDVAQGLHYLHSEYQLNGDEKPRFLYKYLTSDSIKVVKVNNKLRAKLSDVGFADFCQLMYSKTPMDILDKAYVPPECQPESSEWTVKSDVYCLGVVMTELCYLRSASESLAAFKKSSRHVKIPVILKTVIEQCLIENPQERLDSGTARLILHRIDVSAPVEMAPSPKKMLPSTHDHENTALVQEGHSSKQKTTDSTGNTSVVISKLDPHFKRHVIASKHISEYEMIPLSEMDDKSVFVMEDDAKYKESFLLKQESGWSMEAIRPSRWARPFHHVTKVQKVAMAVVLFLAIALIVILSLMLRPTSTSNTPSNSPTTTPLPSINKWKKFQTFGGVSSYFLQNLNDQDQQETIDTLRKNNAKVIRIFIMGTPKGYLGSSSEDIPDVENGTVGVYNDVMLNRIDKLMHRVYLAGMKLIIALHDRDAMGCRTNDTYVPFLNLPVTLQNGTSPCFHAPNDVSPFYNNDTAINAFDNRIRYILSHKNPYFSNQPWSNISEAIYSFDVQNKAQANITQRNETWLCTRAKLIRSLISKDIFVSTGGGANVQNSMLDSNFRCPFVDVISVNALYFNEYYIQSQLQSVLDKATENGKILLLSAVGALDERAPYFSRVTMQSNQLKVSWLLWAFIKPGNTYEEFEFYDQYSDVMDVFHYRALEAWTGNVTKNFTDYAVPSDAVPLSLIDWAKCIDSIQCRNPLSCCRNLYSNDGVHKCTPRGC